MEWRFVSPAEMSFREYLSFQGVAEIEAITVEALLSKSEIENKVAEIPKLRGHFRDFLQHGYYPFFLEGTAFLSREIVEGD